jgi:hypothetical protein
MKTMNNIKNKKKSIIYYTIDNQYMRIAEMEFENIDFCCHQIGPFSFVFQVERLDDYRDSVQSN